MAKAIMANALNSSNIMADIRIYFGNHDKTLIRRQREDGPQARPPGQIGLGASGKNADGDPLTYSRGSFVAPVEPPDAGTGVVC